MGFLDFLKKGKPLVGVDIGSSSIKAIELAKTKRGYQVVGFACEPLGADAIVDGAIVDTGVVSENVKKVLAGGKFTAKGVATGVSGNSVIVKRVVMPVATPEEVEGSIQTDCEQYIPFEINDVNMDFQVIGPSQSDTEGLEVLLVVAKKEKVQNQTSVITAAARTADVVDVEGFALQNAFEVNYAPDAAKTIALLNIGATLLNINIVKGGMPLFIRDVSVGGNQYTDILQKELQLSFQEAEDLKMGKKVGDYDTEMVEPLLDSITDMLLMEVQKTFDFFKETYPMEQIGATYLGGGTSRIAGLAKKIEDRFGFPTEILDPFKAVEIGSKVDREKITSMGPSLAIAVGLALRGFDA